MKDQKQLPPNKSSTPLTESTLVRTCIKLILVFSTIFMATQIGFVFRPIIVLFSTLFLPVLIAGAFFYLLNPVITFLHRLGLHRTLAILLLYIAVILLLVLIVSLAGPPLSRQIETLINNTPNLVREARIYFENLQQHELVERFIPDFSDISLGERAAEIIEDLYKGIGRNLQAFTSFVTGITLVLSTVPFILFFMLKDGHHLPNAIMRFFPPEYRPEGKEILMHMNATLAAFVQGQMIVSLFVGTFVYLGYLLIGVDYALLLAFVALVTNLIPYVGPIIGTVPGLVVALLISPVTMLQVLVLIIIVQQVESQLISPLVMGKKLKLHPLTVIFVLLTAGSLAGFFGLLLAVPGYAVARTAIVHGYKLYMLKLRADRKIIRL
ncbi:AI-2E family transporter [Spirochaeta dissipatitropha]